MSKSPLSYLAAESISNNGGNLLPPQGYGHAPRLLTPHLFSKSGRVIDFILIVAVSVLCDVGYQWFGLGILSFRPAAIGLGLLVAINFVALSAATGKHRHSKLRLRTNHVRDCIRIWIIVFAVLAVIGFTMKISSDVSRGTAILFFLAGGAALVTRQIAFDSLMSQTLSSGWFAQKNVIFVTETGRALTSDFLTELHRQGLKPVSILEITRTEMESLGICTSLRAKLQDLIHRSRENQVEDIYLNLDWHNFRMIESILGMLAVLPISVHLISDKNTSRLLNNPISSIGKSWAVELAGEPLTFAERISKRCLDLVLASAAIVLLSPLMLVTAILIKLDSKGPVFFLQKRNGFNGQAFSIFKFRTMSVLEDGPVVQQTRRRDPRVTRVGRWLRQSSIDELPQLFNVLKGQMSLVGPRPHAEAHNTEYSARIMNYAFRHHVKPGITGWAQVKGFRGETSTIDLMERRVEHDLWYINNWSLALDVKILVLTVLTSFRQPSAY